MCLTVNTFLIGGPRTTVSRPVIHGPLERRNPLHRAGFGSTATGIRTPVSAVRGRRPSPLDDGGWMRQAILAGGGASALASDMLAPFNGRWSREVGCESRAVPPL